MKNEENKTNVEIKTATTGTDVMKKDKNMALDARPVMNGPFTLMKHFAEDMEAMFEDFGFDRRFPRMTLFENDPFFNRDDLLAKWAPAVDLTEKDGALFVRADLPGMTKDDIDVEIKDNRLIIKGERKNESEEEKEGVFRSERSYGSFYRSFVLPEMMDIDKAKARFNNGVLEVEMEMPKAVETGKKLEINEGTLNAKATSG